MDRTSKVRFALVGCGAVAEKHVVALSALNDAEIVAVCDVNRDAAKARGDQCKVPYFDDPKEMAKKVDFDVFTIMTPSGDHARSVLDLACFKRHFVIEKPMALRIEDADDMIAACDASGSRLFVVQQNRCNPPIVKLRQAIQAGRFGRMVLGTVRVRWSRPQSYYDKRPWRGTWALDGGVLTNQASHHIDMLLWMMGEVESVSSMTATRLAHIEAEDTGVALIRFTSGALGVVEATTAVRPKDLEGSISILGEGGSVEIGGFFMNELKTWNFVNPHPDDDSIFADFGKVPNEPVWNLKQYLSGVIESLSHRTKALVDGLEGRKSLEIINAIYESSESGQTIPVRFRPKRCRLGMCHSEPV